MNWFRGYHRLVLLLVSIMLIGVLGLVGGAVYKSPRATTSLATKETPWTLLVWTRAECPSPLIAGFVEGTDHLIHCICVRSGASEKELSDAFRQQQDDGTLTIADGPIDWSATFSQWGIPWLALPVAAYAVLMSMGLGLRWALRGFQDAAP